MKMRGVFEKDPTRRISRVVKIDQHEEDVIGVEVEEYVVTEQIGRLVQDFIDQFLETRIGRESDVCAWISGFFGSGKSHLAKMLGYILTNRPIILPDGRKVEVTDYFHEKHGLSGTGILARELKIRGLFLNMLKFDRARDEDLSRYVYRALLRDLGLSEVLWVAEMERTLKDEGLWESFKKVVEEETGKPWESVREIEVMMRPALVKALTIVKPETYPDMTIAEHSVEDQRREFLLGPERLGKRLVEEAIKLDEEQGRIVLILDEVGLYLRTNGDRLTELNSLAEEVEKQGRGKVWLVATAQEALEQVAPDARTDQIGWLRDRFSLKYSLSPENIPQVTNRRLLQKNRSSRAYGELKGLYDKYGGQLALAARIQNPARDQEIFARFDFEPFSKSYPLLPYHIPLMMAVFAVLRAKGRMMGQETRLAGRERAVLSVVQSMLIGLLERDAEVGSLATFDLLYDSIESVLKIVSSDYHSLITERVAELGTVEGLQVSSVAKALFLLQQVRDWVPTTATNVAAVLYPHLGADPVEHRERVEKCLKLLLDRNWVKEEEGNYRFLSEPERNFERDVRVQADRIRESEMEQRALKVAKGVLKDLRKYSHRKIRIFDVHVFVDDQELTRRGYHKLKVYTPLWSSQREEPVEDLYHKSLAEEDTVYWVSEVRDGFPEKLRRILAVEKVLDERTKRARSPQELAELEGYREEVDTTIHDELPRLLESVLRSGTILFYGEKEELDGRATLGEIFNRWMKQLTEECFTRFDEGAARIEKDEVIRSILTWRGAELPPIYGELKLIDRQNNIITSGPIAHALLEEMKKRGEVKGSEIFEHFSGPPYGWDEGVLRLGVATLFKHGSVQVEHEGYTYTSPENPQSHAPFMGLRTFQKAVFSVGVTITAGQKREVANLISKIFGVDAGVTTEQISGAMESAANDRIKAIQNLKTREGYRELPYTEELNQLEGALEELLAQTSHPHRVLAFLKSEVFEAIERHTPLLDKLKGFVEKERLTVYTTMRQFAETPLSELIQLDRSLEEGGEAFKERITSKALLDEWEAIYDQFSALEGAHHNKYIEMHKECQKAVESAVEKLKQWAKEKDVEPDYLPKVMRRLESLSCSGGAEGAYDEITFLCGDCKRTLSRIRDHESLVQSYLEDAKKKLIEIIAKEKEPKYKRRISQDKKVTSKTDLQGVISRISEFAGYWIERGKKLRLKIEGEVEGG